MTRPAFSITRRSALMGAAALPFAAATAHPAFAAAEMLGAATTRFNRFKLGSFEVTALLAGTRTVPEPHTIFGLNASPDDFAAASAAANIPTDKAQFFFTPTVVNTGAELVLFDTGLNPAGISSALAEAGIQATIEAPGRLLRARLGWLSVILLLTLAVGALALRVTFTLTLPWALLLGLALVLLLARVVRRAVQMSG